MLVVAVCVALLISVVGGIRGFGWTATALGTLGLIHAAVIIALDITGAPLDYRLADSRMVLATAPVSVVLFAGGLLTLGLRCCWKHRPTSGRG